MTHLGILVHPGKSRFRYLEEFFTVFIDDVHVTGVDRVQRYRVTPPVTLDDGESVPPAIKTSVQVLPERESVHVPVGFLADHDTRRVFGIHDHPATRFYRYTFG